MLATIVSNALLKLEEQRADNWANMQADEKVLLGGIEYLNFIKDKMQDKWSGYKISSIIPFSVGKFMDISHPNIDSRIAKIKTALKTRFGVDA